MATLDASKLASEHLKAERERQALTLIAERRNDYENEIARSEAREGKHGYQCPKCDSKRLEVAVVTMAASEDPDRELVTCLECNNQWLVE